MYRIYCLLWNIRSGKIRLFHENMFAIQFSISYTTNDLLPQRCGSTVPVCQWPSKGDEEKDFSSGKFREEKRQSDIRNDAQGKISRSS